MHKAQRETVFEILFHAFCPRLNDQKHQVDRISEPARRAGQNNPFRPRHRPEPCSPRDGLKTLLSRFTVLAQRIQQVYDLTGDQAATYLMQVQQTLIGCWAVSHPAPVVEKILDTPGLDLFRVDFKTALQAQLKALEMAL